MKKILLVGCGNMGGAMLVRWVEKITSNEAEFFVISPENAKQYTNVHFYESIEKFPENISPDVVIFAVKPQMLSDILPLYKNRFGTAPLYISIAAGKNLSFFCEQLGEGARLVRTMPNTPAKVGKAMTALCANKNASAADKEIATFLMNSIGATVWVEEKNMNAVTAISGSGPAYVFLFLDALTNAGVNSGLDSEVAKKLAIETVHGSLHLVAKASESFASLRQNVTSKGGTTEAALSVLMSGNALENLLQEAVISAVKRAEILEKS